MKAYSHLEMPARLGVDGGEVQGLERRVQPGSVPVPKGLESAPNILSCDLLARFSSLNMVLR